MPSIAHEAAVELLRRNPQLAAALLASAGVQVPATAAVRRALEELMATTFPDPFIDGLLDQGRAEGEARGRAEGEAAMLLRVLAARGFTVPDDARQRIQSCTDLTQLEAWGDRAVTATSLDEIFTA
jgi:hypothetical protein